MSPAAAFVLQVLVSWGLGAVAVWAGGPVVGAVFAHVDREQQLRARREEREAFGPPAPVTSVIAAGVHLRGGSWIGMLERLAIYAGLMVHYPEAIAVCLALKGLARYPELKATSTGAAERFIIGTFVSVLVASAAAGAALYLCGPVLGRWR